MNCKWAGGAPRPRRLGPAGERSVDWYPLINSLRIAAISSVIVFFAGIFCAYYVAKLPRVLKGVLDVVLTLPLVLPPTVVGYFLLLVFGVQRPGRHVAGFSVGIRFVMTWYGGVITAAVVAFPLMYRTARGAFESFDDDAGLLGADARALQRLHFLADTHALLPSGHPRRDGARLRAGAGRVRRDQYAHRLHARAARRRYPPRSTSTGARATTAARLSGF